MEQRSNFAAAKDVRIKSDREERVGGMGLRSNANYAAGKNVQIKLSKEECVLGTGPIARVNKPIEISMNSSECSLFNPIKKLISTPSVTRGAPLALRLFCSESRNESMSTPILCKPCHHMYVLHTYFKRAPCASVNGWITNFRN